jgi:hypothetical protein
MDQPRPLRTPSRSEVNVGIPIPSGLTAEQIDSCERFSLAVFGSLMFDRSPSHNGRHGYACELCLPVLAERDAELERVRSIAQPWEAKAA